YSSNDFTLDKQRDWLPNYTYQSQAPVSRALVESLLPLKLIYLLTLGKGSNWADGLDVSRLVPSNREEKLIYQKPGVSKQQSLNNKWQVQGKVFDSGDPMWIPMDPR